MFTGASAKLDYMLFITEQATAPETTGETTATVLALAKRSQDDRIPNVAVGTYATARNNTMQMRVML
jgi:hypothetical protein